MEQAGQDFAVEAFTGCSTKGFQQFVQQFIQGARGDSTTRRLSTLRDLSAGTGRLHDGMDDISMLIFARI
jgi:hypothetical protein